MHDLMFSVIIQHMEDKIDETASTLYNRKFYELSPYFDQLTDLDLVIIGKLIQMTNKDKQAHNNSVYLNNFVAEVFTHPGHLEYSLALKSLLKLTETNFTFKENSDGSISLVSQKEFEEIMFGDFDHNNSTLHIGTIISNFKYSLIDEDVLFTFNINDDTVNRLLKMST